MARGVAGAIVEFLGPSQGSPGTCTPLDCAGAPSSKFLDNDRSYIGVCALLLYVIACLGTLNSEGVSPAGDLAIASDSPCGIL